MAAFLKQRLGADSEIVEGNRGEFTVWVGDAVVARKDAQGFPSEQDVLTAVQKAIAQG